MKPERALGATTRGQNYNIYESGKYLKDQCIFEDILDEDSLVLSRTTWVTYIL